MRETWSLRGAAGVTFIEIHEYKATKQSRQGVSLRGAAGVAYIEVHEFKATKQSLS
jgi:hypothetical protein